MIGDVPRIASFHLLAEPGWRAPQVMARLATDRLRLLRVPGLQPDPRSRSGAIRIIGHSPSAGFAITVIVTRSDHAGASAWKTTGPTLREYEGQGRL